MQRKKLINLFLTIIRARPDIKLIAAFLAVIALAVLFVPLKQMLLDGANYRQTAQYKLAACETLNLGARRPNHLVDYLDKVVGCMAQDGFSFNQTACPVEHDSDGKAIYTRAEDYSCYSR